MGARSDCALDNPQRKAGFKRAVTQERGCEGAKPLDLGPGTGPLPERQVRGAGGGPLCHGEPQAAAPHFPCPSSQPEPKPLLGNSTLDALSQQALKAKWTLLAGLVSGVPWVSGQGVMVAGGGGGGHGGSDLAQGSRCPERLIWKVVEGTEAASSPRCSAFALQTTKSLFL